MKRSCLGIIVAIGLTLPAFGQQAVKGINPEGVYHLNFEKSTLKGPIPKTQTINVVGDELTLISIQADGKPFTATYPVILDGKSHPVAGETRAHIRHLIHTPLATVAPKPGR